MKRTVENRHKDFRTKGINSKKAEDAVNESKNSEHDNNMDHSPVQIFFLLVLGFLVPVVNFYLMEFYSHTPFTEVRPWAQFFNILLFELIAWILIWLTGRLRLALSLETIAAFLYGLGNAYVVRFRENPIVPWDLFSIRTAASVANNYDFMPDRRMLIVTGAFLALFLSLQWVDIKLTRFSLWKRMIPSLVFFLVLIFFTGKLQEDSFQTKYRLYPFLFTPVYMTNVDGLAVTFAMNLEYMSIEKPAGYSSQKAQEILESYEDEDKFSAETGGDSTDAIAEKNYPNIIVVMNEAFSDLAVLGDFTTNEDYMPFVHQLQEGTPNTVTGYLNVSVCGGNTANTEFEFLTGNTMAFLPQGSIPYQQYVKNEVPSIASYLKGLGYETVATHPYRASGWERDRVYPLLGFSSMEFMEDYFNPHKVRQYISDKSCVDKIIELYENKRENTPLFVFNVTMQNHGGYTDSSANFTPDIFVEDVDSEALNNYLSLIKLSDEALEELVSYFEQEEEPTVIVFFGDHQPNDTVASPVLRLNGMQSSTLTAEQQKLRYQVPYVIWANYEMESETQADTSANYLAEEVLLRAGMPVSPYQSYLGELSGTYPIISAVRMTDSDGNEIDFTSQEEGLNTYQMLEYYQLFDRSEE